MRWEIIQGFENYKVSENGDILRIETNKILKPYDRKNYLGVYLYNNGIRKFKLVHRLVAAAFIKNTNNYPQVNHKDENTYNNNVKNLEWCTAKYNANYGMHKEKIKERMKNNNPFKGHKHTEESKKKMSNAKIGKPSKRKRVVIINNIKYESIREAMQKLGISTRKVYKLINKSI